MRMLEPGTGERGLIATRRLWLVMSRLPRIRIAPIARISALRRSRLVVSVSSTTRSESGGASSGGARRRPAPARTIRSSAARNIGSEHRQAEAVRDDLLELDDHLQRLAQQVHLGASQRFELDRI